MRRGVRVRGGGAHHEDERRELGHPLTRGPRQNLTTSVRPRRKEKYNATYSSTKENKEKRNRHANETSKRSIR